jgi:hypothetical protein
VSIPTCARARWLTLLSVTALACGQGSTAPQPTAPTVPVAIRVTVRVSSLDPFGATPADFPVSAGGEAVAGSSDGVVFAVRAGSAFQVSVSSDKPEGYAETLSGFCGGDAGAATAAGDERLCTITETEQPLKCDPDLWRKTYAPWRFRKYSDCEMGSGTVDEVWQSEDGDLDMTVRPDGSAGLAAGQTLLMVEVPCQFPTSSQMPKDSCGNAFQNSLRPVAGMRIRFAGPRVADGNHTPAKPQTENHGAVLRILSRRSAQTQSARAFPIRREGYLGGGRYEREDDR